MVLNKKLSESVKKGTSYRSVFKNIVVLAEGFLKEKYPQKTREERIILAQQEPYWSVCRENYKIDKSVLDKLKQSLDKIY